MIENVLVRKDLSRRAKITVKSLISIGIVALAVILPQLVHLAAGQVGGAQWLPMYLPVLLGGCLLGWTWGLALGVASPVVSFLITLAFGNPMPALARLPFMIAELSVFAAVSGLFSKLIAKNGLWAFPAVISAQVAGRGVFLLLAFLFRSVTPFAFDAILLQVQSGLWGLALQAIVVPFVVMGLKLLIDRDKKE